MRIFFIIFFCANLTFALTHASNLRTFAKTYNKRNIDAQSAHVEMAALILRQLKRGAISAQNWRILGSCEEKVHTQSCSINIIIDVARFMCGKKEKCPQILS